MRPRAPVRCTTIEHNSRDASVTGGFVYHGTQYPASLQGSYFFGDYAQNWIKRLTFVADGNVTGVFNFEPASGQPDGPDWRHRLPDGGSGRLAFLHRPRLLGHNRFLRCQQGPPHPLSAVQPGADRRGCSEPDLRLAAARGQLLERRLERSRGRALTYSWDFGDGSPLSTDANPVHTYTAAGQYTVRLTVSDGSHSTFSTPISIQAGGPPTATVVGPLDAATFRAGDVITLERRGH